MSDARATLIEYLAKGGMSESVAAYTFDRYVAEQTAALRAENERLWSILRKVSVRTRHADACEHNDAGDCSCLARRDELLALCELRVALLAAPEGQPVTR